MHPPLRHWWCQFGGNEWTHRELEWLSPSMKRQGTKDDKEKSDLPEALLGCSTLLDHYFYSSIFLSSAQCPWCGAACSEVQPPPPPPATFWLSVATSRQKSIAAASCRPGLAFRHLWAVPEAGCQVSVFQQGEASHRYPATDRQLALQRCSPSLTCYIHIQEAASAVKQSFLNRWVVNFSSTVVRREHTFRSGHLKSINKHIMR